MTQSIHFVLPIPRVPRMGFETRRPLDPTRLYSTLVDFMEFMSGSGTILDVNTKGAFAGPVETVHFDPLCSLGEVSLEEGLGGGESLGVRLGMSLPLGEYGSTVILAAHCSTPGVEVLIPCAIAVLVTFSREPVFLCEYARGRSTKAIWVYLGWCTRRLPVPICNIIRLSGYCGVKEY